MNHNLKLTSYRSATLILLLGLCLPITPLRAQFFTSAAMSDSGTSTFTVNVAADQEITDVNFRLSIQHDDVYLISAVLVSPLGTRVSLFNGGLGVNGANLQDTFLDDQASNGSIGSTGFQTPPYADTYKPNQHGDPPFFGLNYSLSTFNGEQSAGTWTLELNDNVADGFIGQLLGQNAGAPWGTAAGRSRCCG